MIRVACLTPPGTGAIATIAVHGVGAWDLMRKLFRPAGKKPLPDVPIPGSTTFGRIGDREADEVVLVAKSESEVELNCHGGRQVVLWLLLFLERHGCERCHWASLSFHEARQQLALAKTLRTAEILLDQLGGALSESWEKVEAGDVAELNELARWTKFGRHLVEPWRVVIAGAPNVGKSSLVNALAGYARCVVAPIPGTTRDLVTTTLALDGWPIELIDTAGLRESGDVLEREGISRTQNVLAKADLCVWVFDGSEPLDRGSSEPKASATVLHWIRGLNPMTVADAFGSDGKIIIVRNKIDLSSDCPSDAIPVSAETKVGIDVLSAAIVAKLIPEVPEPGVAVPFNDVWCDRVVQRHRATTSSDGTGSSG